jgi:uracil DNA glycosylase superfamily protein
MDAELTTKQKARRRCELGLLRRAAEAVVAQGGMPSREKLLGFLAMVGERYSSELMVIGHATNGWPDGQYLSGETLEMFVENSLKNAICPLPSGQACPMRWVTDLWGSEKASRYDEGSRKEYNAARSAFWRAVKGLTAYLNVANIEEDSWPSHLAWTNLYKVAPAEGNNPSNALCDAQFESCASLLRAELEIYAPKRVVFLTGRN